MVVDAQTAAAAAEIAPLRNSDVVFNCSTTCRILYHTYLRAESLLLWIELAGALIPANLALLQRPLFYPHETPSLSRTFLPSLSTSQLPQKYLSQFLHDPTTTFTSTLYLLIDHLTTKNKPPGMLSLFFLSASASSPSLGRVRSPPRSSKC
jgi:hypothetical protein